MQNRVTDTPARFHRRFFEFHEWGELVGELNSRVSLSCLHRGEIGHHLRQG